MFVNLVMTDILVMIVNLVITFSLIKKYVSILLLKDTILILKT